MTEDTVRATLERFLGEIAPEADFSTVDPDRPLRHQLDIDSMDYLNFLVAIQEELGVDVPEADYSRIMTLSHCSAYVAERLPA